MGDRESFLPGVHVHEGRVTRIAIEPRKWDVLCAELQEPAEVAPELTPSLAFSLAPEFAESFKQGSLVLGFRADSDADWVLPLIVEKSERPEGAGTVTLIPMCRAPIELE